MTMKDTMKHKLDGLIAATFTPLNDRGDVNLAAVDAVVEYLLQQGVKGLYVCGSTGEGMSLSIDERKQVAEAYVNAAAGRVPVIVQVGHNSLVEARGLAAHAEAIGADIVSATCPSYFKVADVDQLVDCMASLAAGAPSLPFYYYHIPALTGSQIDIVEFLKIGANRIENLRGLKYTDTKLFEFQSCLSIDDGRFDVVWGCDEMLLGAVATGAQAAIGSTYNVAAPLYQRMIDAFTRGDLDEARRLQYLSVQMIRTIFRYPFHAAMKSILTMRGLEMGACRLPLGTMSEEDVESLRKDLDEIEFFDYSQ